MTGSFLNSSLMKSAESRAVLALRIFCIVVLNWLALSAAPRVDETPAAGSIDQSDRIFRPSGVKGMEEAYLPGLSATSHASNLLLLKNGDLLCFWFSGVREGESNVAIVYARLPAGSHQWTKTTEIDHQSGRSFQNPVAFQPSAGRIWLLHTSQPAGEWQANAEVLSLTSDDNGGTWRGPSPLFTKAGSFVRQPPLTLGTNDWLIPMYYTPGRSITDGAESNYSSVKLSRDDGKSWRECEIPHSGGLVQPSIVRLSRRHFIAFFRSRYADFIYRSDSTDGCRWSAPAATQLPNNNSSIQAVQLKDGALVMAFNNTNSSQRREKTQAGPRKPLSVAFSTDGGETWPWVRDIETGNPSGGELQQAGKSRKNDEYSYPSILQDRAGKIDVAYTYRHECIKVARFDEAWIKNGSTVGKFQGDKQPYRQGQTK